MARNGNRRPTSITIFLLAAAAFCLSNLPAGPSAVIANAAEEDTTAETEAAPIPKADEQKSDFMSKVVGAAAQGLVAAVVAAWLSAFTEPVVNRLLVERLTVVQAINAVKLQDCLKFFLTTFPTNMLKFPVFEVINGAMAFTSFSGGMRGVVSGWLFCTVMLPVTNYRFRKSMNLPIEPALLYQAYPPTVLRDIVYGWARGFFGALISEHLSDYNSSFFGKSALFGLTVFAACVVSAPFNEWRGFWLQPPQKKLPFSQFFKPERFTRSTGVGATIMGISLFVGALLVPYAETLYAFCLANLYARVIAGLVVVGGLYLIGSSK
jgi:hypothetical protein